MSSAFSNQFGIYKLVKSVSTLFVMMLPTDFPLKGHSTHSALNCSTTNPQLSITYKMIGAGWKGRLG